MFLNIYMFLIKSGAKKEAKTCKKDFLASRSLMSSGRHKPRMTLNQENKMVSHKKNMAFSLKEGTRTVQGMNFCETGHG